MPRKPSLTKQIADKLGTEDKTKQLERIDQLIRTAQVPPTSVTVLYTVAGVDVTVASPTTQVTAGQIKQILQAGIDEVTKQIVLHEQRKQEEEAMSAMVPPDDLVDDEI